MVKKSKNIFEKRNPFSNLNNEKTKKFVKQLDEDDNIRTEILKIEGARITSVNERILKKIDFSDREFINREISFEKILETEAVKNLAESINEIGLINPVYIIEKKDGKYKILSGFRRLSALYYGYENIKNFNPVGTNNVIIVPENTSYELLDKISLHENTLREDLTTLEISFDLSGIHQPDSKDAAYSPLPGERHRQLSVGCAPCCPKRARGWQAGHPRPARQA